MLILQVIVQAEPLGREVLANDGHPEIAAIPAAIAPGNREAQMARGIGAVFRFAQQFFPFVARQSAIVEIGARPFAAVIEEADIVILLFERLDLTKDEGVEFGEIGDQIGRQGEIHGAAPDV